MAKVIGFDPQVRKRCTCPECGAIIEYAPKEVFEVKEYDYTGSYDMYRVIRCPNCVKVTNIKVK